MPSSLNTYSLPADSSSNKNMYELKYKTYTSDIYIYIYTVYYAGKHITNLIFSALIDHPPY